jgi:hypothetical protein
MGIITLPRHRDHLTIEEPGTVMGLTVLVSVQCRCGAETLIGLLNAQAAVCELCGKVFTLDAVSWKKGSERPSISLSSSPSRAEALSS